MYRPKQLASHAKAVLRQALPFHPRLIPALLRPTTRPPVDSGGNYTLSANTAFAPSAPTWTYVGMPVASFYSAEISGAQRLPNGNTLITEGVKGNLFEVTTAGEIVWRYMNPVTTAPLAQGSVIPVDANKADQFMNAVFRVTRYGPDFPGLQGKVLTPLGTIESY